MFQILMSKIMKITTPAILVLFPLFVACGQTSKPKENLVENDIEIQAKKEAVSFNPDSSINNVILLENSSSTLKTLGDVMSHVNADADYPDAYFKSSGKGVEYLRVVFFPGNESNSLSQFEVGNTVELESKNFIPIDYPSFKTESGIKIGMSKNQLLGIKGEDFIKRQVNGQEVLNYRIDDFASSTFLKKYNMPVYFAEYWFTNDGRLVKYKFGFEYP